MPALTSIKIRSSEHRAIKALAKKKGVFVQRMIEEAIRQYVDSNTTLTDLVEQEKVLQSKEQAAS
jgi:predicted transcriptional regulator